MLKGTPLEIPQNPSTVKPPATVDPKRKPKRRISWSAGRCSGTTTDAYCHFGFGLTTGQSFGTGGSFCCFVAIFSSWWQLKYFFNFHPYKLGVLGFHDPTFDERAYFFNWVELKPPTSFCKDIVLGQVVLGGGFKYFLMFTPIWGRFPCWLINIFQMGWNHQLGLFFGDIPFPKVYELATMFGLFFSVYFQLKW